MRLDETARKSAVKVLMKRLIGILLCLGMAANTSASWYWPFGSDDSTADDRRPRLSELMEPASIQRGGIIRLFCENLGDHKRRRVIITRRKIRHRL